MLDQNVSVIVKRKNIQVVVDYCLDNRIETKMIPRDMPEEWELDFAVVDIMKAINLGMFLRENKLELVGLLNSSTIKNSTAPTAVKATKTPLKKKPETAKADEQDGILDTGGIFNTTSVNTENIFNTAPVSATIDNDDELPL
jgi:hypothetical protein